MLSLIKHRLSLVAGLLSISVLGLQADTPAASTVIIIRHAEKPATGWQLTAAGEARAQAYVNYFQHLTLDGQPVHFDRLVAAKDSAASHRPRLTIEPTAKALGLPIDLRYSDKDNAGMVRAFRQWPPGTTLICWRHGEIPELLHEFGVTPRQLLPQGRWPDNVFGWMLVLHLDASGHLLDARRVEEHLMPDDAPASVK